jgi:hypothetical protein
VIDLLHETISPVSNTDVKNDAIISLDENDISKISNELFNILTIKTKLLNQVSETKKTIEELDVPYLRELIIKHSGSESLKNTMIKCDYCEFSATTRRAVTAHINHQHTDKYKKNKEVVIDDKTSIDSKDDETTSITESITVTETKKKYKKKEGKQ